MRARQRWAQACMAAERAEADSAFKRSVAETPEW